MAEEQKIAVLTAGLRNFLPGRQILQNVSMTRYTTLRIGGPADVLAVVTSPADVQHCFAAAAEAKLPVTLLGNGSNVLVDDSGIEGLVLLFSDAFSRVTEPVFQPHGRGVITAEAGASLQKLCSAAADASLSGLEFASGIPGTVGGAIVMNAGAYGGEMKDVVTSVTVCRPDGEICTLTPEELQFGYRHSCLMERPGTAVLSASVTLPPGDRDTILTAMREFNARRRARQPVTLPSCGSTFKRPEGNFAGTLIEQCGLKETRIGGCSVSGLHAGFLVNDRNGTSRDYRELIRLVQQTVKEKTGVPLEPEVRILPARGEERQ